MLSFIAGVYYLIFFRKSLLTYTNSLYLQFYVYKFIVSTILYLQIQITLQLLKLGWTLQSNVILHCM